ncbi:hypothetical protein IGI04_024267 [Brassica rapa subsp. trilocularis]|uniref:Uncharacterized protein n=1 Tax=Brassica rapa subsp. trilocularis TaxID=1813537 RepID=A0ABQ7M9M7_BRACM|nr:hypothetical protein IGI04_024267 [Brassica rapa subsp. trilocularis]
MFLRNNNSYHPNRYYIHYRNQLERPVQVLTFLKTATMVIKRWRPDRDTIWMLTFANNFVWLDSSLISLYLELVIVMRFYNTRCRRVWFDIS